MNLEFELQKGIDLGLYPGCNYAYILTSQTMNGSLGYRFVFPKKEKNTIETIYDIASLSKVVSTTSIILKLHESRVIDLKNKVNQYIQTKHSFTIEELLMHTSGLPSDLPYKNHTKESFIEFMEQTECIYPPKTKIIYSDLGYIYLGLIIEAVTHKSLDDVAKEMIFKPLKMFRTDYKVNVKDRLQCATTEFKEDRGYIQGEVHDGKGYLFSGVAGSAGVFSTIGDLEKYVKSILKIIPSIFEEETYNLLNQSSIHFEDTIRTLGWILKTYQDKTYLYHTGFTGTLIILDLKEKRGFILLTNRIHYGRDKAKEYAEFRDNITNMIIKEWSCGTTT